MYEVFGLHNIDKIIFHNWLRFDVMPVYVICSLYKKGFFFCACWFFYRTMKRFLTAEIAINAVLFFPCVEVFILYNAEAVCMGKAICFQFLHKA